MTPAGRKIPRIKSAGIGAIMGVIAIAIKGLFEPLPALAATAPYWFGVALMGGLIGVGIGGLMNANRR